MCGLDYFWIHKKMALSISACYILTFQLYSAQPYSLQHLPLEDEGNKKTGFQSEGDESSPWVIGVAVGSAGSARREL